MHGLGKLGLREHLHGLGVALFLGLRDEARIHVGGLENLAVGGSDQVQVNLLQLGGVSDGALVARLQFLDQAGLQADVHLLGGAGGLPQAAQLLVALLLRQLGAGGVLRGSAGLAADGGLQVLKRGANFAGGAGNAVEVGRVLGGGQLGALIHNAYSLSSEYEVHLVFAY